MQSAYRIGIVAAVLLRHRRTAATDAQQWPSRPITYVVPFTPGGTTDTIGRRIAAGLAPVLGQPVVVDNKPGAAGAVGAGFVAKAKPDGYTLLGGTISTHAINASLYKDLPYDPVKDFEPITLVGFIPNALYVNPNLGVNIGRRPDRAAEEGSEQAHVRDRPAQARPRTWPASCSPT